MKKLLAFILAMMLVLSMASIAVAEGTTTYTITAPDNGHTYEILQIFEGDLSGGTLSNVTWGTNGKDYVDAKTEVKVSDDVLNALKATQKDKETLQYIEANLLNTSAAVYKTIGKIDNETKVLSVDVPAGYYMIRDAAGSQEGKDDSYTLYIVNIVGDVTINPKADKPSMIKKIKDTNDTTGQTSDWIDSADYDIGDHVPFRLTGTLPSNFAAYSKYTFEFIDDMETGLTFDGANTVKVYVNDSTVALDAKWYTVSVGDKNPYQHFEVKIPEMEKVTYKAAENGSEMKLNAGDRIHIEYTATLNESANIGAQGNMNKAYLKFSNNPNGEGMGETPKDTVIAFTYKLVIDKVDGNKVSLAGADFKLEKQLPNDVWVEVTRKTTNATETTDATQFVFTGLDDGIYCLTETKTPAGYNTLEPIVFTVTANHKSDIGRIDFESPNRTDILEELTGKEFEGKIEFKKANGNLATQIVNKSGATLPETGGIGTTIFYVLGGVMFAGAALMLVVRRKAEADEN